MRHVLDQDTYELNLTPDITKVGVKISGGADSAITAYMVATYVRDERPDIELNGITSDALYKQYQVQYARQIMNKVTELTGVPFANHYTNVVHPYNDYATGQDRLKDELYSQDKIHFHATGITCNPSAEDAPHLHNGSIGEMKPVPSRDRSSRLEARTKKRWMPLINTDKKGVADLYNYFGVMDDLFPLTRSCEKETDDFTEHCGECWFCHERMYGFGRLV